MERETLQSQLREYWDSVQVYFIVWLIPLTYGFQMVILFPQLVMLIKAGPIQQYVHIILSTLCLVNVCGNLIMSVSTESNMDVQPGEGIYCELCKSLQPIGSWHCKKCETCILKRDYHCRMLSTCIGIYNKRYYVLFLGHVAITMIYATTYNYFFIIAKYGEDANVLLVLARIISPFIFLLLPEPMDRKDIYTIYVHLNIMLGLWASFMFMWHFKNVVRGVTCYENKYTPRLRNIQKWKQNMVDVFGLKWYWAIVWPFIESPLPHELKRE